MSKHKKSKNQNQSEKMDIFHNLNEISQDVQKIKSKQRSIMLLQHENKQEIQEVKKIVNQILRANTFDDGEEEKISEEENEQKENKNDNIEDNNEEDEEENEDESENENNENLLYEPEAKKVKEKKEIKFEEVSPDEISKIFPTIKIVESKKITDDDFILSNLTKIVNNEEKGKSDGK